VLAPVPPAAAAPEAAQSPPPPPAPAVAEAPAALVAAAVVQAAAAVEAGRGVAFLLVGTMLEAACEPGPQHPGGQPSGKATGAQCSTLVGRTAPSSRGRQAGHPLEGHQ